MSTPARTRASRALVVVGLILLRSVCARAADEDDGVYGRFAGDLDLRANVGFALLPGNAELAAGASAHYLSTAGVYVLYAGVPGRATSGVSESVALGVDVSPVFLARYAKNLEHLSPFVDLLLDSIGFELGALWDSSRSEGWTVSRRPGAELAVSLAVPLMARATGLYLALHAGVRWNPWELAQEPQPPGSNHYALLSLGLGWRQLVRAHLVDARDTRSE